MCFLCCFGGPFARHRASSSWGAFETYPSENLFRTPLAKGFNYGMKMSKPRNPSSSASRQGPALEDCSSVSESKRDAAA